MTGPGGHWEWTSSQHSWKRNNCCAWNLRLGRCASTLALLGAEIKQRRAKLGRDLSSSQVWLSSSWCSVKQECCNILLWSQQPSRHCWKSTTGTWNPSGQWGGSSVTMLKIIGIATVAGCWVLWFYVTHSLLGRNKENMEQDWAGACFSLCSVWHCRSCFVIAALPLVHFAKWCPLCAHSNMGVGAYWTNSCQRHFRRNSAKRKCRAYFFCFYWIVCKCCKLSCTSSICKFSLYWLTSLGLKRIFRIWSVMAKGQGVPFSMMQGLISDKSTSSAHRSVRDSLGCIPSAS